MEDRMAAFSEKYEFEDEFTEQLHMSDMMQFVLASKIYSRMLESATSGPYTHTNANTHT